MGVRYTVIVAIKMGILIHDVVNNTIAYASNPANPLKTASMGKKVMDVFVKALTTDEGKEVYADIQAQISPEEPKISKMEIPKKELFVVEEKDSELIEMIGKLVDAEVIKKTHPSWHTYKDKKFQSADKLLHEIKNNKVAYDSLKEDYERVKATV